MTNKEFFNLNELAGQFYEGYEVSSLGDSELNILNELGAEAAFYWYGRGSYEGSGQLIFLREGMWHVCDLGHCSCYGPEDGIKLDSAACGSLSELEGTCSTEYRNSILPLINLIKSKGYGKAVPDDIYIGLL